MSFLLELFAQAPTGESPYAYAAGEISKILPKNVHWFFWLLGVGSVVNAANLVLNLVCVYMIGRRKLGGASPYWLVRLRYDHPSGVPYLVPNAIMTFLLFNGIFAFLMQPYIWINYVAYWNRSVAPNTGLFFWYGFIFVFDGSGMWISAFGTFYATLLPQLLVSNNTSTFNLMVHPTFLNTLCYGLPAILFVIQTVTSTLSQIAWRDMVVLQFAITDKLQILDNQWTASNGTSINQNTLEDTITLAEPLIGRLIASRVAFVRNAITCGAWYLLCFLFFTPSAIWLLHMLQRTVSRKLQFVTRMPETGREMQFQVALQALEPRSMDHEEPTTTHTVPGDRGEHRRRISGEHRHRTSDEPESLHPPPSYREGTDSNQTTPTSAVFLAPEHQDEVVPPSPVVEDEREDVDITRPTANEHDQDHVHRPYDPGRHMPWEVNHTKTTRKLQTAYYSAMLQFSATAFCLAIAAGSWLWAAADVHVMLDPTLHAVAVLMTVWVYPVIGIIVNTFICIRLRAIGFHLPKSKWMGYLSGVWASNSSRDRRATVHA